MGNVIPFTTARPAALARRAKRDPFLGLHPRCKAIVIDRNPDGTFGVRIWPVRTPQDDAVYRECGTARDARIVAQNAIRNAPKLFQFVVDRSDVETSGDAA